MRILYGAALTGLFVFAIAAGCSDRSTSSPPVGTTGTLSVYIKDGPVRAVTAADVTFSELKVHNRTTGQMIDLLNGREVTIDLVKAHDDPYGAGFLGNFNVPAGQYDGLGSVTIKTVSFTTDQRLTCTDPRFPMSAGPIIASSPLVEIAESGAAKMLVDLPLVGGTCDSPGGVDGRLEFDLGRASCGMVR